MAKSFARLTLLGLAAVILSVLPAFAHGPRAHGRGRADVVILHDRGFHDFDGHHLVRSTRGRRVIVVTPRDRWRHHPPGWDHGRKVGWGNCDLPPGLAKKDGCHGRSFRWRDRRDRDAVIVLPLPRWWD